MLSLRKMSSMSSLDRMSAALSVGVLNICIKYNNNRVTEAKS